MLMSTAGALGVRWISLAPLSTMAVSERLVPVGKQKGMEVGVGMGLRLVEGNSQ